MKTITKTGAIASIATTALLATAGMASASGAYSGGVLLSPGAAINGQSTGNSTLTAGTKVITCSNTTAAGTVTTNPGAGVAGNVTGSLSSLAFNNGAGTDCTTAGIVGFPTASVSTNSPFAVSANASTFTVSKAGGSIVATITLKGSGTPLPCVYDDGGVGAPAAVTGSSVKFTNVPLRKQSGSALCPGTSTLGSANFTTAAINLTTTGGGAVTITN
jgi:hypothetical protein